MKKIVCGLLLMVLCLSLMLPVLAEDNMLAGGWSSTEDATVTEEARAALDKAMEGMDGSTVEPIALLGTQVVAGVNYCLLCRVTPVVPDAVSHYALVYVYDGVDGTAELLSMNDLVMDASAE